jgi:hypothetical protein
MKTMVRERVTHHLELGETEDSKTGRKYVECTYPPDHANPRSVKISELNEATKKHPEIHLSISMQDDILWTSDKPFSIDLKDVVRVKNSPNPRCQAAQLFFRNAFPWYSVESQYDHKHRVHSGALNPDALPMLVAAKGDRIELKFTATQLDSSGEESKKVKKLDPHVIIDP